MNRRKAVKTLSLAMVASCFTVDVFNNSESQKPKPKPKHFIGLGDTGYHIINSFYEDKKLSNTYFTCIIDEKSKNNPTKIECIRSSKSGIIKSLTMKNSDRKADELEVFLFQQKLKDLFSSNHQYILIAGLGGKTGSFWMAYLTDFLIKNNVEFLSICHTPFSFEGKKQQALAQRIVDKYKEIPQFKYFSLNTIRDKYGNMTLREVFAKARSIHYQLAMT